LNVRYKRQLEVGILEAKELIFKGKEPPNPYCSLSSGHLNGKSTHVMRTTNPSWNVNFNFVMNSMTYGKPMVLDVRSHSTGIFSSDQSIGICSFLPSQMQEGIKVDQWLRLIHQEKKNSPQVATGDLHVSILISPPLVDSFLFVVKKEAFSFGDFHIKDENGISCFLVVGSWPNHFHFKDKFGRPTIEIKKRSLIAIEPSYDLYQAGTKQLLMTITRRISFMTAHYDIETSGDRLDVQGDIFTSNYKFVRKSNREIAAWTHREYFTYTDTYSVEISPTENVPLLLACIVVLEHEERKRRK